MDLGVITIRHDRFRATLLLEAFRVLSQAKCKTLMGYVWSEPYANRDAILALGPYLIATVDEAKAARKDAAKAYADEWRDVKFVQACDKARAKRHNAELTTELKKAERKLDRAKKLLAYWQKLENK